MRTAKHTFPTRCCFGNFTRSDLRPEKCETTAFLKIVKRHLLLLRTNYRSAAAPRASSVTPKKRPIGSKREKRPKLYQTQGGHDGLQFAK